MTILNLNQTTKLYYGNTEVQKLYKGSQFLYPVESDPYFNNVVLLLKGQGPNDSTTIVDSSSNPTTITRLGNTKISTAQSKYGGSSLYFNGTTDSLATSTNTKFLFDVQNMTVEAWVYTTGERNIFGTQNNNSRPSGSLSFARFGATFSYGFSDSSVTSLVNYPLNQWVHLALTCQSGVYRAFINGVLTGSPLTRTTAIANNQFEIGTNGYIGQYRTFYSGYMDSFRITKGVARYITNFNPETETFLS
jgi:hypothetical protein